MEKKIILLVGVLLAVLNAVTMYVFAKNNCYHGVVSTPCATILFWLVYYLIGKKAEQERLLHEQRELICKQNELVGKYKSQVETLLIIKKTEDGE